MISGDTKSGKKKIYYSVGNGRLDGRGDKVVGSSWNPGRCRPSKRFIHRKN